MRLDTCLAVESDNPENHKARVNHSSSRNEGSILLPLGRVHKEEGLVMWKMKHSLEPCVDRRRFEDHRLFGASSDRQTKYSTPWQRKESMELHSQLCIKRSFARINGGFRRRIRSVSPAGSAIVGAARRYSG